MDTSIHFYEFDVVKWVVDCMSWTPTTKIIGTECIESIPLHSCKTIIQMDRDMFIAVHTGKGEQRNMRAVTQYNFNQRIEL